MHEEPRIVVAGGGTGGHLYPALAIGEALLSLRPAAALVYVGAERGIEARVLPERGVDHLLLPIRGLARGRPLSNWRVVPGLLTSVARSWALLRRLRPGVVVVTGGYAAAPAGLAAVLLGAPLVLQEQNVVPGVTTRALSRWARTIFVAFPEAAEGLAPGVRARVEHLGNPVRPAPSVARGVARARLELPEKGRVLLVIGGSQGALGINRLVEGAVERVVRGELAPVADLHVLWVTGPKHHAPIAERLEALGSPGWVRAIPYLDDVPTALAATDLALSRAGAMSTAELLNQSVPAILVPLPTSAEDHQQRNAEALAAAGAADVLREAGGTPELLWDRVRGLLGDPARLAAMGAAAGGRARPDAARQIATRILEIADARHATEART